MKTVKYYKVYDRLTAQEYYFKRFVKPTNELIDLWLRNRKLIDKNELYSNMRFEITRIKFVDVPI